MSFALITGASKGIGLAMARELASRQVNILLVARDQDALESVATQLATQYKIQTHVLATDLSQPGSALKVFEWCSSNQYQVQYLLNNAGYGLSGKFENYPLQDHLHMMNVNMNAVVELTYLFLPQLKQQPRSYILNIASSAAYQAVPYLGIYAATKAFVLQFSRALQYELRSGPVTVTCISPGPTASNFINRANIGPKGQKTAQKFEMKAETVAKIAIDSMFQGKTEVITGFLNKLQGFFVWLLPKKFIEKTAASIYE